VGTRAAWLNAQLHDDDVAELNALPDTVTRLAQCAAILDGYELSSDQRVGFVDKMIEFALRSTRDEAQTYAITSDTTSPAHDGFPILWAATWRARLQRGCLSTDPRSNDRSADRATLRHA
jgi:hypothetical protein